MRRLGIRITNIALFTLCCFFLADIANKVSGELLLPRVNSVPPAAAVVEIPVRSWDERKPILQRNLFGAQVVTDSIVEAQPEPEQIEKTELPLELLGTIASGDEAMARATIWDKDKSEHQVLQVGDRLKHHAEVRLGRVERRRVILINGERLEELNLEDREKPRDIPPARKLKAPRTRRRHPRRSSEPPKTQDEELATQLEELRDQMEREQLDEADLGERLEALNPR